MREFIVIFLTLLIARYVSEAVYTWIGLDYSWFKSEFNLGLLLADFSIFVVIYLVVYTILKKLILRTREQQKRS